MTYQFSTIWSRFESWFRVKTFLENGSESYRVMTDYSFFFFGANAQELHRSGESMETTIEI